MWYVCATGSLLKFFNFYEFLNSRNSTLTVESKYGLVRYRKSVGELWSASWVIPSVSPDTNSSSREQWLRAIHPTSFLYCRIFLPMIFRVIIAAQPRLKLRIACRCHLTLSPIKFINYSPMVIDKNRKERTRTIERTTETKSSRFLTRSRTKSHHSHCKQILITGSSVFSNVRMTEKLILVPVRRTAVLKRQNCCCYAQTVEVLLRRNAIRVYDHLRL